MKSVALITPTTGRTKFLKRCIESVLSQGYEGQLRHYVIGDHLNSSIKSEAELLCKELGAVFINDNRPIKTKYAPARTGRLRNLGVKVSEEQLIGFLDDDNTIDENHVRSLVNTLAYEKVDISYSWRRMLKKNGQPCRLKRYPWVICEDNDVSKEVFKELVNEGIFTEGSEIIRDKIPTRNGDLFHIDSSEWIMKRHVFNKFGFMEKATPRQMIYSNTEDYVFCKEVFKAGYVFKCSEKVTLNYYLGGYHAGRETILEE